MVSHWTSMCLSVRQSYIHPSVFHFRMITWVNINGFSPNLVCAWILWRSGLGLLMGKFHQILMELSARDMPIFSFSDDYLSKSQGILTKLGTCIDLKEICLGLLMGKFCQCLTELSACDTIMAGYYSLTFLFPENRLWYFMQIVSKRDSLNEDKGDNL